MFGNLFGNKTIKNCEAVLNYDRSKFDEKIDALALYLVELGKYDNKKEMEVFMKIVNAFKDLEKPDMFTAPTLMIKNEILYIEDKKNMRGLLDYRFCKVFDAFTMVEWGIFANMLENKNPYLDLFVNGDYKGDTLRIDFKGTKILKNIDFDYYLKSMGRQNNNNVDPFIKDIIENKKVFLVDNNVPIDYLDFLERSELKVVNPNGFYNAKNFMVEKEGYPVLLWSDKHNKAYIKYVSVQELERLVQRPNQSRDYINVRTLNEAQFNDCISNEVMCIPYMDYLDMFGDINFEIGGEIVSVPKNILNRNSNIYIVKQK